MAGEPRELRTYIVTINQGQRVYTVGATDGGDAAIAAGNQWRRDTRLTKQERDEGIWHVRARRQLP